MKNSPCERILVVTVDTEEEGLWGNSFSATGNTTENLKGLPRFQAACETLCVPPTYLIDAPVLANKEAMIRMRHWQNGSLCEVGAHCHAWCNPPLDAQTPTVAETFLNNYPKEIQFEKLQWLTNEIAESTGHRPTSYRSGRYGFDDSTAEILDELGYLVDSSVLPLYDYSSEHGPNFLDSPRKPFPFFGRRADRRLLEVPVTSGFVRPGFESQRAIWTGTRKAPWRRFRLAGIADRLGIARRVKLTPEGTSLENQKKLVDSCVADGLTTLVLMLHSSSLVAGLSPYCKTPQMLELFYTRFRETIDYAVSEHGFQAVTLSETASLVKTGSPGL